MLEKEGNLDSKPHGNYFKKINPQILIEYLEEHQDAYLHEIAAVFPCSEAATCKALKKIRKDDILVRYPINDFTVIRQRCPIEHFYGRSRHVISLYMNIDTISA